MIFDLNPLFAALPVLPFVMTQPGHNQDHGILSKLVSYLANEVKLNVLNVSCRLLSVLIISH